MSTIPTLSFNAEGIKKINQILEHRGKVYYALNKSKPNYADPAIVKDVYRSRVIQLDKSVKFTTDVFETQDTLLIQDNGIIFSIFIKNTLEINKRYNFIPITLSAGSKYKYNLSIKNIIGVVKSDDDIPEEKFWSDVAQDIYDTIIPAEHIIDMKSSVLSTTSTQTVQNISYMKINQTGVDYINSRIKLLKYDYQQKYRDKKGHENPDNPIFMNKIASRVNKSRVASNGIIQFTVDLKSNFEMFVIEQKGVVFSLLNNGRKLNTNNQMNYKKDIEYDSINIFINGKQYFIDLNDIVGIVKTDNPEGIFWYELAKDLSNYITIDGIDISFQPSSTKQLSPTAAAKSNSPKQSSAAAKSNSPKQSSAAALTNTILVTMPRSSERKLKKLLTTSAYKEHTKVLKDLSEQNCKSIITELQKITDLSIDTKPKPTIKNPKHLINSSHKPIEVNFDSDIVLTALSRCYHDIKVQDVLEVINADNLYSEGRANSRQRSNTVSQNTAAKTTVQKDITLYDIVDSSFIEAYKESCDSLKNKSEIEFDEYVSHMQRLIRILKIIYDYFKNITKDAEITIYLFDEETKNNYHKHINIFPMNNMTNIDRGIIFNDHRGVKKSDDVLKNTYLNRAIQLSFFRNPNIMFNYKYPHNNYDDVFEYHRYMSILPKFHCLNSTTVLKTKDNETLINVLLELNAFTRDFPKDYVIKGINKSVYEKRFQELSSYTDYHALNKLLYVLINNNYNTKQDIQDYYYYFPYDGPSTAISAIDAADYVKFLDTYQPLDILDTDVLDIESYYKGTLPLFSKVVNEALQNHILNGVKLTENTTRKLEYVMKYAQYTHKSNYDKDDIYVFHGTQTMMHAKGEQEINLISFLSCSFNIYISIDYALNNLIGSSKIKKKGIVYIFKIQKHQKYVNFKDALYQIVLLPGTKIKIQNETNIGNIKYILCHIDDIDVIHYSRQLLEDIKQGTELLKTMYNIKNYKIIGDSEYPHTLAINFPTDPNDIKQFRSHVENIFVMTTPSQKEYIYTCLGKLINNYDMHTFNNMQYTIHQHFFNDCYDHFNVNRANYILGHDDKNIYTMWEVDADFGPSHNDFNYNIRNLLIDCLLGNIDCTNSRNYLVLNSDKTVSKLMMLKGCGLYNTSGFRKPRFNRNQEPFEYLGIFGEIMHTIPNIQNMNKEQLRTLLDCDNFLITLKEFPSFVSKIHNKYDKFLINNLQIATNSSEFKDLKEMLNNLMTTLKARVKYFETKMDDVLDNIMEYIQDIDTTGVVTGGDAEPDLNIALSIQEYAKKESRSRKRTYEMVKNIPVPTDTKYKVKYLIEPYKSYYIDLLRKSEKSNIRKYRSYDLTKRASKKIESKKYKSYQDDSKYDSYVVDTFNEGYCVSNEKFEEIKKRLFAQKQTKK
jgi:hypothetical protein